MTIKREDVDRRIVVFSDITSGRRLPPVYPGKILRDEFPDPHVCWCLVSTTALGSFSVGPWGWLV
jgi:hypothetical protein